MKTISIVASSVALLVAGCGGTTQPASRTSAQPHALSIATAAPTERATAAPTGRATAAATSATPRLTVKGTAPIDNSPPGLLAAIRTRHYADHDQVVFQFHGRQIPSAVIRYVDEVREDPSDKPVPLLGQVFLNVAFHGGRLDTAAVENDPSQARHYRGPTRLTPRYATLRQLAVSGDFEAVLSFGLGLSTVSGLSTSTLPTSGGLVLDIWRTSPGALLWPVTSVAQAREVQAATDSGHQPWVLSPSEVATLYVEHVLGWSHPSVQRLAEDVYQATAGTRSAVITMSQPLSRPGTVWAVARVVQSRI